MLTSNVKSIDLTLSAWPDGSGRCDNRLTAQHLSRDLVWPSNGLQELAQTMKTSSSQFPQHLRPRKTGLHANASSGQKTKVCKCSFSSKFLQVGL